METQLLRNIMPMLTSLGFTEYESRVYLALISRKQCTAAEAGRIQSLPLQRELAC
ncbi:hypothetical protein DRQ21_11590 [Candidatus Fermentibacteria bacterium]|nr:MAG: hypothetical protein DRQ21_11590 [Candidatus Fermentibacteria bacterium]